MKIAGKTTLDATDVFKKSSTEVTTAQVGDTITANFKTATNYNPTVTVIAGDGTKTVIAKDKITGNNSAGWVAEFTMPKGNTTVEITEAEQLHRYRYRI